MSFAIMLLHFSARGSVCASQSVDGVGEKGFCGWLVGKSLATTITAIV